MISLGVFFIFSKFWMAENYACHASYLSNYASYDCHLWYTCIKSWYLQVLSFFKMLIFWVVKGVKEQKMVQNENKFCLWRSLSQESYIMWFSFMVHMSKMIIFPSIFFIFSKFWFSGLGQKIALKWQKSSACHAPYLKNHTSHDSHLWYTSVK